MNKSLLAYFLACLTTSALMSSCTLIHPALIQQRAVQVNIQSDSDVRDVVAAVESLKRQDIDVHTSKRIDLRARPIFLTIPLMAFGFMLMTGLVLVFYKLYCRWLGAPPTI